MRCVMLFVAVISILSLKGQQFLVRYDVVAEELKYYKIRKADTIPVNLIHVNGSGRVNLQVINIGNGFRQQVLLHQKPEVPESIQIPGIGGDNTFGIQELFRTGADISVEDLLESVGDNKMTKSELKLVVKAFVKNYNRFNEEYSKWIIAVKQLSKYTQLWRDLASLRYTLQYDAITVKQSAFKKTRTVLPELTTDTSALLKTGVTDPAEILRQMKLTFRQVKDSYGKIEALDIDIEDAATWINQMDRQLSDVQAYSDKNPVTAEDLIERIKKLYSGIMTDTYSQLTNLPVSRKTEMAELRFIPNIDSITAQAIEIPSRDTITRWLPIIKKEPMRFRNTVGFGFVTIPENRWRYHITADSTLVRSYGDAFQPLAATYLHFYSMKDKGFRWGGSFGAGIPISGEDKQLNLMLGMSTFFGKNDPVCLTIGIAGARVKKLMEWNVGDKLPSTNTEINYEQVYRLGYFLSLSFNPAALNARD